MIVKMDFNKQGKRISSNAQLLLMSMHDSEELKLDTAESDKIALSKPANDPPLFQQKRGRGRPRKNPIEQQTQSKPANDISLFQKKRGRGRPRKNPIEQQTQSKPANDISLFQKKRGRGRPRKNPIEQQTQSKPANDLLLFQQKRGRVRPRKNPVESEIQINLKKNYISDIKEKLKLLETITNGYKEIERIDKETQKNVEKLCAMIHNSK